MTMSFIDWETKSYFAVNIEPFFSALKEASGSDDNKLIIGIAALLFIIIAVAFLGPRLPRRLLLIRRCCGSGGRRSLRLPLRSRRAAAARRGAAMFIGDEMAVARRRAGCATARRCASARRSGTLILRMVSLGSGSSTMRFTIRSITPTAVSKWRP